MKYGYGFLSVGAIAALAGCAIDAQNSKGEKESDLPVDGAADSFRNPTEHGALSFDAPSAAALAPSAQFHAWTFSLFGNAEVSLTTGPSTGRRYEVDTVVYLYRRGEDGRWGRYIARNDDSTDSLWSSLDRALGEGEYRVIVKGYTADVRGEFALAAACDGAGCTAPPPPAEATCLFGTTYRQAIENAAFYPNRQTLTSVNGLDAQTQEQIVLAVRQSSHTDVTTAEEALARVDDNQMERVSLYDSVGARAFVAFEYGAGDNSYGAIFASGTTTIVAKIHDGDLDDCSVTAQACLFGQNYGDFRNSTVFEPTLSTRITSAQASSITSAQAAQLLSAVKVAYSSVTDVASALSAVDQGEVNLLEVHQRATGAVYRSYEYGAGDNSYGAIFAAEDAAPVATIHDGDLYDCSVFAPSGGAAVGENCGGDSDAPCAFGLACQGPVEGVGGKCAPRASVPGDGDSCASNEDCAHASLICAGLTRGDEGFCVPLWLRGSVSSNVEQAIPDGSRAGLTSESILYGLASVDMDVEIRALIRHPRHRDLRVLLVNPAGAEVTVFEGRAGSGDLELDGPVLGFSGDEQVNGRWTLRVIDTRRGQRGTLVRWAIDVTSRWD